MGRVNNELRDKVLFPRLHPQPPRPSTPLLTISRNRRPLEVTRIRDSHRNLFICNEILELQLSSLINNLGAPSVPIFIPNLRQLLDNHLAQLGRRRQNRLVLRNIVANFSQLLEKLVNRELSKPVQLQFQDGVDLLIAQNQRTSGRKGHIDRVFAGIESDASQLSAAQIDLLAGEVLEQVLASFNAAAGLTNRPDDVVQVIKRDLITKQDVFAVSRLTKQEGSAPAYDLNAVIQERTNGLIERKFFWLTVVHGQEDH